MKKFSALILSMLLPVLLLAQPGQSSQSKQIALAHVTVIDATGVPARKDMTVIITADRITQIGEASKIRIPQGAQLIDATGKFLIPCLWDMHVHFWNDEKLLSLYTANGVTGVRDMGGDLQRVKRWREAIALGTITGPRIVAAGEPLDKAPFELALIQLKPIVVKTAAEAVAAVDSLKRDGSDFIKVLSPNREAYFAAAAEAKKQKIDFAGHVPDTVTAAEASDAGQKSMEHLFGIAIACSSEEADLRSARAEARQKQDWKTYLDLADKSLDTYSEEKARALFSRFVKNGTYQVPSFALLKRMGYLYENDTTQDARLRYIPHSIKDQWENPNDAKKNLSAPLQAYFKKEYRKLCDIVRTMQMSGVAIMAGTDTGDPYTYPGFTLHEELGLLVEAGLTPMQALQAATLNPAKYLGMLDSIGTVEEGKTADLVLLDANPLDNISNTQKIDAVIIGGKLISKTALDKILAQAEAAGGKSVK